MMTRWLFYIDFDAKHVPGNKNNGADALSRRDKASEDEKEDENEVDDYFDAQLYGIIVSNGT